MGRWATGACLGFSRTQHVQIMSVGYQRINTPRRTLSNSTSPFNFFPPHSSQMPFFDSQEEQALREVEEGLGSDVNFDMKGTQPYVTLAYVDTVLMYAQSLPSNTALSPLGRSHSSAWAVRSSMLPTERPQDQSGRT